jgi:hypothetical protein
MKSGKQRREELRQRRARRAAKRKVREAAGARATAITRGLARMAVVNPDLLAPDTSYGTPVFVTRGFYVDMEFTCADCGTSQVWTSHQQKWWYEVAKGSVWTTATRCRPCRRRERERRTEARRVHLEGVARKHGARAQGLKRVERIARKP